VSSMFVRITAGVGLFLAGAMSAQAVVSYSTTGSIHAENFDSLAASGTNLTWTNDATLPGWFAYRSGVGGTAGARDAATWLAMTQYSADDGAGGSGFWSYGGSDARPSVNPNSDRALGSVPAGSPWGDFVQALVLRNDTGETLTRFTLSYAGEQWRGGAGGGTRWQDFDFRVSSTFDADADLPGNVIAGYELTGVDTANPFLDFSGGGGSAVHDGNTAARRQLKTGTVYNLGWGPGDYLVLRWWHDNASGSDHGLAVDDLTFSAVPEPASLALLSAAALLMRRRCANRSV